MRHAETPPRYRRLLATIGAIAVPVAMLVSLGSGSAAVADEATTIAFGKTAQTAMYGSDWYATITVATPYRTLDAPDGTVDVYADGATSPFVGGIILYRGGKAYLTPDVTRTPLAAGTHTLTAIYRPSGGSGLISSQTVTPLTIAVTPLGLKASAKLDSAASTPTLTLSLSGAYVDALSSPAGEWTVAVTGSGTRPVFSTHLRQPSGGTNPISVDLGDHLSAGDNVTITASFTSADAAAGASLTQPTPLTLRIPDLTAGQVLSTPVPWWALFASGLLVLLAAAVLIVQFARLRRSRSSHELVESDPTSATAPHT